MSTDLQPTQRRDRGLRMQRRIRVGVAVMGTAAVGTFIGVASVRNAATASTTTATSTSGTAAPTTNSGAAAATSTPAPTLSTPAATVAPAPSSQAATVSGGSGHG
jgi:hypothetical protein